MICANGCLKLSSFGLGMLLTSKELYREKGWYSAPEVLEGNETAKSDVWSLGVLLVELVEGKKTYDGDVSYGNSESHQEPPYLSFPECSAVFVAFVKECLVTDVNERVSVRELMEVRSVLESD